LHARDVCRATEAVITDSSFFDNMVAVNGGGMFQEDTSGTVTNTIFKGNKALVRTSPSLFCMLLACSWDPSRSGCH
jgi:hypothetical protein